MTRRRVKKGFRVSTAQLVTFSAVTLVVGIGLFYAGTRGEEQNALVTGIASALVSVGAVTLVAEVLMRNAYTYDLLEMVDLEQLVYETGLCDLSDESHFDWSWISSGGGKSVQVALLDPRAWLQRDWPSLVEEATKQPIDIEVYLPQAGSVSAATAAALLGIDDATYAMHVDNAATQLRSAWQLRRTGVGALHASSHLTIVPVPEPVAHGLVRCGTRLAFIFPGMHGADGGSSPLVVALDKQRGPSIWHDQASRVLGHLSDTHAVPQWTDRKPEDDESLAIDQGSPQDGNVPATSNSATAASTADSLPEAGA